MKAISYKNIHNNVNRAVKEYEKGRIEDLRSWGDNFFKTNSLEFILWWTPCISNKDEKGKNKEKWEKVDLILKCLSFHNKDGRLTLVDRHGVTYDLVIGVRSGIQIGEFIKLRCVNVLPGKGANANKSITLTNLSSCLKIPKDFLDAKRFDKVEKNSPKKGLKSDALAFLNDYVVPEGFGKKGKGTFVSAVRKSASGYEKTTVAKLLDALNNASKH